MDPELSRTVLPGTLESYTYNPFIPDDDWFNLANRRYDPVYMYKAADEGITITTIRKHLHDSVPYPSGSKPAKPNAITIYFPDTTGDQLPYSSTREHILLDMDPVTQIPQLFALLSIARSDSPDPVPELIKAESAQPVWPGTPSQTALSHPLLRELLLVVVLRSFVFQGFRLAPGAQDLVKHIALAGPPVVPHGVRVPYDELSFVSEFHRRWIWTDEGSRWCFLPRQLRLRGDAEAALVRNGWRDPKIAVEHLVPPPPPAPRDGDKYNNNNNTAAATTTTTSKDSGKDSVGVVAGMSDLVDALLHVGYLDTDDKRADVLTKVARYGTLEDIKFTLNKIDRESITLAHECEILPAAAAGGKGRAEILAFLLKSGLDPNGVGKGQKDKKRTALHVAIRQGDVDMVRILLEAGAKMVKDEDWGLPIEAAEALVDKEDEAAKVAILQRWLEGRGLSRDHVDSPVFIDEDLAGFSGVGWAT